MCVQARGSNHYIEYVSLYKVCFVENSAIETSGTVFTGDWAIAKR